MNQIEFRPRLKASAFAYAVLISLVLTLITLALVSAMQLHQHRLARITDIHQVGRDLESGMELMLTDPSLAQNGVMAMDLFGDGRDSVFLERRPWGAFEVISVMARCGSQRQSRHELVGTMVPAEGPVLTLADKGKPLSVCGNTRIQGDCRLPEAGVKRAYIEGKNYSGRELIYGAVSQSASGLVELPIHRILTLLEGANESIDFQEVTSGSLRHSFSENTMVIRSNEPIDLFGMEINGNILIHSDVEISVGSSSSLSRCILSAPKIRIDRGFKGDVQMYGDSVIVDTEVQLEYPSGVYSNGGYIRIDNGSMVAGTIVNHRSNGQGLIEIGSKSKVYGVVHSEGGLELRGSIYGQVFTEGFVLRTASATYENHLLDATIQREGLPLPFGGVVQPDGKRIQLTALQ